MGTWIEYKPQFVRRRYNRLAPIYVFFEWLFWLPRGIRPRAVERLDLKAGDCVLEVGCGTGRNLAFLSRAVGPDGRVYGIDLSEGMLAKARSACGKGGLTNVLLIQCDASEYELPEPVDGAIFSLSYAVMRDRKQALRNAWRQLKPDGRMVMLDAKVLSGFLGRTTRGLFSLILRLTVLGNPDVEALKDIRELTGQVEVEELQFGTYFIARAIKPISDAHPPSAGNGRQKPDR
jgi:SAM-dependent methyltransferase